jgi:hypothetical protein
VDNSLFILTEATGIQRIITWLAKVKTIVLMIVPLWTSHSWFIYLKSHATHQYLFPLGCENWSEAGSSSVPTAFIVDFRFPSPANNLIVIKIPSLSKCASLVSVPREIHPFQHGDFLFRRPKPHFSVAWFLQWGKSLPSKLLKYVLLGLQFGFPTLYRGGGRISPKLCH